MVPGMVQKYTWEIGCSSEPIHNAVGHCYVSIPCVSWPKSGWSSRYPTLHCFSLPTAATGHSGTWPELYCSHFPPFFGTFYPWVPLHCLVNKSYLRTSCVLTAYSTSPLIVPPNPWESTSMGASSLPALRTAGAGQAHATKLYWTHVQEKGKQKSQLSTDQPLVTHLLEPPKHGCKTPPPHHNCKAQWVGCSLPLAPLWC